MATLIPALGACASRMTGTKTTMASPSSNPSAAAAKDPNPSTSNSPACAKKPLRLQTHLAQAHKKGFAWGYMDVLCADVKSQDLCAQVLVGRKLPVENRVSRGDFDPSSNKMKLMAMKISKGLGFPLVALPGVGHMPAAGKDKKDAARVFYVAATRATQRLAMGVGGDSGFGAQISATEPIQFTNLTGRKE